VSTEQSPLTVVLLQPPSWRHRLRTLARLGCTLLTVAILTCRPPTDHLLPPLRIAIYTDPLTLDPHARNEVLTFSVLRNLYEALTAFDAGTRVGPALATSWENPDELTWIFHLRNGVTFHNGQPMTARDVVFSLNRAHSASRSNVSTYLVATERVRALDSSTVEITTARPYPILLHKLAFVFIVPAGSPDDIRQPIGTGPYRLVSYQPGRKVQLQAFDHYWGGPPSERAVEFLPVRDQEERVRRLLAGEIDIAQDPGFENIERVRQAPGCKIGEQDSLSVSFLLMRGDLAPFNDARVRRAVSLALDRPALVRTALHGAGAPLGQMVSRSVFGYARDLAPTRPDLAGARALLAAAGHPHGLDLDLHVREGRTLEAAAAVRQLSAVGLRIHLIEHPWAVLFPRLLSGNIGFYFGAWFCLSGDASDLWDAMVHSPSPASGYGASNFNQFRSRNLDTVIEESSTTVDQLTRRSELQHLMHALMDDGSFIPLYSRSVLFGLRENVDWVVRHDGLVIASNVHRKAVP
jgi:peptide/nickel transport system substrate-binding protein